MGLGKPCKCGQIMSIRLRTVIYSNKVEIENVPILSCEGCGLSEVFPGVKSDLTGLIDVLGSKPEKQQLAFHDLNELAHLMYKVSDKEHVNIPVEAIIEERINQLLDILLLAQSLGDPQWVDDVQRRLEQITKHTIPNYDFL